jgi:DNA invertase Pin-like site-specific DNA recombinase
MLARITNQHLIRMAIIYIRQSQPAQVKHHKESQRLQYQLVERAKQLGWEEVIIIDDDLGQSASGTRNRSGFEQLIIKVIAKKVGAIFCIDASRLARNNREWYMLLDYCCYTNTLIIDPDGIYDANNTSDRACLGMKGTMSEYELNIFRQRAQSAIRAKAERGEFYTSVPAAYIITADNNCELNPDQRIQDVTHLMFQKFRELGSVNQLVLWFRQENIELPIRRRRGEIMWKLPQVSLIRDLLNNPIFAGAYVYGRTETEVRFDNGQPRKYRTEIPFEQWKVVKQDHHPAYISWDEFMANRKRLSQNSSKRDHHKKGGAAKSGPALLVGLLRCRRCSQKFSVRYSSSNPGVACYSCRGQKNIGKCENCLSFYGSSLERLVEQEVLRVVQPKAIEAAEKAAQLFVQQQQQRQQAVVNALKQAQYEADRRFEQYNSVDPKNRLVAVNLETQWNQALKKVTTIKQQLDKINNEYQVLTEQQSKRFRKLATDLPALWSHPDTDIRIKKRILQTLIKEIVVDINNHNSINAVIHWMGGVHTQYQIKRRKKKSLPQNDTFPDIKQVITELAPIVADQDIARIFNLLKITTTSKQSWNSVCVYEFRQQHQIPAFDPQQYENNGWVNLKQAAELLGTFPETILRLIKANMLKARQVIKYSPWIIDKEQLKTPQLLQALNKLKNGTKTISKNQTEINFD